MKKCPKCNYIRKPDDLSPDYECPRCGIIYAKFERMQKNIENNVDKAQDVIIDEQNIVFDEQHNKSKIKRNLILLSAVLIIGIAVFSFVFLRTSVPSDSVIINNALNSGTTIGVLLRGNFLPSTYIVNDVTIKKIRVNHIYKASDFSDVPEKYKKWVKIDVIRKLDKSMGVKSFFALLYVKGTYRTMNLPLSPAKSGSFHGTFLYVVSEKSATPLLYVPTKEIDKKTSKKAKTKKQVKKEHKSKKTVKTLSEKRKTMETMELISLRQACQHGQNWACDELKDIESGKTNILTR